MNFSLLNVIAQRALELNLTAVEVSYVRTATSPTCSRVWYLLSGGYYDYANNKTVRPSSMVAHLHYTDAGTMTIQERIDYCHALDTALHARLAAAPYNAMLIMLRRDIVLADSYLPVVKPMTDNLYLNHLLTGIMLRSSISTAYNVSIKTVLSSIARNYYPLSIIA